jgi:lipoprotein-anchoring transpeptidase ErfK/SrfK
MIESAGARMRIASIGAALRAAVLSSLLVASGPARAGVVIRVDRASQTMAVVVDGAHYATWTISTGRQGYRTPAGAFQPSRLERFWRSRKYDNAPMPHSIFFAGGYAIHGTTEIGRLGRRASHGCIRLHPSNAKQLFDLVKSHGRRATRIVISMHPSPDGSGDRPSDGKVPRHRRHKRNAGLADPRPGAGVSGLYSRTTRTEHFA